MWLETATQADFWDIPNRKRHGSLSPPLPRLLAGIARGLHHRNPEHPRGHHKTWPAFGMSKHEESHSNSSNHFRCPYGPDFCRWNGTQLFDDGCVFSKASPFWGPKSKAAQQFRPSFSVSGRCGAERISVTWELPIWTGADPRRQLLAFFTCSWSRVIKILMPCKSTLVGPGTWAKVAVEWGTSGQTFLICHSISLSLSPELHTHSNPTCASLL